MFSERFSIKNSFTLFAITRRKKFREMCFVIIIEYIKWLCLCNSIIMRLRKNIIIAGNTKGTAEDKKHNTLRNGVDSFP